MALTLSSPPDFLKLLAHDLRWQLLTALAHSDYRVQELAERLQRPMNLVSYHLRQLREAGLVQERRSSADGRDLYCSLDIAELARRFRASGANLDPLLASDSPIPPSTLPTRILFLCTHNSARSQMAEGLLRAKRGTRPIEVASAGDQPGTLHPAAIATMRDVGIDISAQSSKHLDSFRGQHFDIIVTVCDQVREHCPVFPGIPDAIHWSIPDPSPATGTPTEVETFRRTATQLAVRVDHLLFRLDHAAAVERTEKSN
jgi:ArsR family transcriptional regulator, arsenate/arsenite/antimonite-responsive transcriptional repressor / arsenate reductase (thioredoxin)